MHVCVLPRLFITSGMIWHDMDPIWLVKNVLKLLYIKVGIINGCGFCIDMRCGN